MLRAARQRNSNAIFCPSRLWAATILKGDLGGPARRAACWVTTSSTAVMFITNAADPLFARLVLDEAERASRITGIEIQPITVRGPDEELDAAFAAITKVQADAVVIQGSLSTKRVADLALERRLPAASTTRAFVDAGGLMSYGADGPALFRLGAKFVHRILQGRQPNDLPIEQPTKFELAVNLKTAKAMGLTIPESFLLRADALIE